MTKYYFIFFEIIIFCSLTFQARASHVIGIDQSATIWLRKGISSSQIFGTAWEKNPSTIEWASVPGGVKSVIMNNKESVWALNQNGDIFIRLSLDRQWEQVSGKAAMITLNNESTTLALDPEGTVYLRSNTSSVNPVGTQWKPVSNSPKMSAILLVSNYVWALDATGQPYFSESLSLNQETLVWTQIIGKNFKSLFSNILGHLWALDTSNNMYVRIGITKENPTGSAWKKIDGKFTYIALTDEGAVFGIDPNFNSIFTRKPLNQGNLLGTKWETLDQPIWLKKTYQDQAKFIISSNLILNLGTDIYVQFVVEKIENQIRSFYTSHLFARTGIDDKTLKGTGWSEEPVLSLSTSSDAGRILFENNKCYMLQPDAQKKELLMPFSLPQGQDISKVFSFSLNKSGTTLMCLGQLGQGSTKLYVRTGVSVTNPLGSGWQEIDMVPQGLSGTFKTYATIIKTTDDDQIWALFYYQEINKWILVRRVGISMTVPYGTGWKQIQLPPNLTLTDPQFALVEGGLLLTCATPAGVSAPNAGIWFKKIIVPDSDGDDFIEIFKLDFDTTKYESGYPPKVFLSSSEDGTIIVGRNFVKKDPAKNFLSEILWYQSEGINYANLSKTTFKPIALPEDTVWSMITTKKSSIWAVGQKGVYFRTGVVQPHVPGEWKPMNQKMVALGSRSIEIPPLISRGLLSKFEKQKTQKVQTQSPVLQQTPQMIVPQITPPSVSQSGTQPIAPQLPLLMPLQKKTQPKKAKKKAQTQNSKPVVKKQKVKK